MNIGCVGRVFTHMFMKSFIARSKSRVERGGKWVGVWGL